MNCQLLSPWCLVFGVEVERGVALYPAIGPTPPPGTPLPGTCTAVWTSFCTTNWVMGDSPSGTVIGPSGGVMKRGSEAKKNIHAAVVFAMPEFFPPVCAPAGVVMPVVDYGYAAIRIMKGSTKTNWAPFSVKADNGNPSVVFVPYAPVTVLNQRHCCDVVPAGSILNVNVAPSSVFLGMSAGDFAGSVAMIALDVAKDAIKGLIPGYSDNEVVGALIDMAKDLLRAANKEWGDDVFGEKGQGIAERVVKYAADPAEAAVDLASLLAGVGTAKVQGKDAKEGVTDSDGISDAAGEGVAELVDSVFD